MRKPGKNNYKESRNNINILRCLSAAKDVEGSVEHFSLITESRQLKTCFIHK